jgi:hypothetical protein
VYHSIKQVVNSFFGLFYEKEKPALMWRKRLVKKGCGAVICTPLGNLLFLFVQHNCEGGAIFAVFKSIFGLGKINKTQSLLK